MFGLASQVSTSGKDFPLPVSSCRAGFSIPGLSVSSASPHFLHARSTGFSTCCPSPTPFGLGLGPGFPRADQLYPGILRYSAWTILTSISLLIPAFSLHTSPPPFSVRLLRGINAPLPTYISLGTYPFHGFGDVFEPRSFSARGLSASELLRTLSMSGCF